MFVWCKVRKKTAVVFLASSQFFYFFVMPHEALSIEWFVGAAIGLIVVYTLRLSVYKLVPLLVPEYATRSRKDQKNLRIQTYCFIHSSITLPFAIFVTGSLGYLHNIKEPLILMRLRA
jgi:hypothetical protein